jgi:hypothetical protein
MSRVEGQCAGHRGVAVREVEREECFGPGGLERGGPLGCDGQVDVEAAGGRDEGRRAIAGSREEKEEPGTGGQA